MSTRALALTIAGATALGVVGSLTPASAAPSEGKLPWVVVMAEGRVIAEGTPEQVGQNQAVIDAYLGVAH